MFVSLQSLKSTLSKSLPSLKSTPCYSIKYILLIRNVIPCNVFQAAGLLSLNTNNYTDNFITFIPYTSFSNNFFNHSEITFLGL